MTIVRSGRIAVPGLLALALTLSSPATAQQADAPAAWAPETSVALAYFATDIAQPETWPYKQSAGTRLVSGSVVFSPDGRYFLTIRYRGDVATDSNVATLEIYSSEAVRRALRGGRAAPAPFRTLEMRSYSSSEFRTAVRSTRWDGDAPALLFEGFDDRQSWSFFRYDIASGRLDKLTDLTRQPNEVIRHWYRGGSIVRVKDIMPVGGDSADYPMRWPVRPNEWLNRTNREFLLSARCAGQEEHSLPVAERPMDGAVAPTGCLAILQVMTRGKPDSRRFMLLDMRSLTMMEIARAAPGAGAFLWSPDGATAALTRVSYADGSTGIALFDSATRRLDPIAGMPADYIVSNGGLRWQAPGELVLSAAGKPSLLVRRDGQGWRAVPYSAGEVLERPRGFTVAVEQALNSPPRLVARSGARAIVLSRPDPALAGVRRGDWQEVSWVEDGRTHRAGLLLPTANAPASGAPPLVVEVTQYDILGPVHDLFLPDGTYKGGSATAQSLAARGFAVLRLDGWNWTAGNAAEIARVPEEGPTFVRRLDLAIDALVRQKLIDPARVGLMGFSRSGWVTVYTATHPGRTRIGAYIGVDNRLGTSGEALLEVLDGEASQGLGNYVLAPEEWRRADTLFGAPNVQAPMLFTQTGGGNISRENGTLVSPGEVQLNEVLGSFAMARRPTDRVFFPYASHQLQRPRERLVLMNAIIDWMRFWLRGEDPADPALTARWTRLRTAWDRQRAWEAAGHPVGSVPTP